MSDRSDDDHAALKSQLLGRIGFSVIVLAALLASLVVFDLVNTPESLPEKNTSGSPGPAPTAAIPASSAPDTIKSEQTRSEAVLVDTSPAASAAAIPEATATPSTVVAPAGQVEKTLSRPATGRHALMRAPETAVTGPSPADPTRGAVPSRPQSKAAPNSPGNDSVSASPSRSPTAERPFALQLGVFSDLANAEELRARLEKAGIKASIEARVRVGPFATRAEADAARAKLRELGVEDALLFSIKSRKTP